jgi:hypothetical protein
VRGTVSPAIRRYWFDALVVAAAIGGVLELVWNRDAADAPTVFLAVSIPLEAGLTLLLLGRRRFRFAAPAALSFWEARLVTFTFASFIAAMAACFLLGNRRQAVIGLMVTMASLLIIVGNNTERQGGDFLFIPLLFSPCGLAVSD